MKSDSAWAEEAFGAADLGDERRTVRLVELATALGQQPSASLPEATEDLAALKGAYRFFDNSYVRAEAILASHVASTRRRLQSVPLALAVQDTTYLDWTDHEATTGLGPLGATTHQGLLAHTTLLLTPERVPLGVLQQQVWVRPAALCDPVDHQQRAISEKESQTWLTSLDAVIALRAQCPQTHFVSVGDREADVFELFLVKRPVGVDLLVRAAQDRRTEHAERYLWATVCAAPCAATVTIHVGTRAGQPARTARLDVHWRSVTLRPPKNQAKRKLPTVTVWAVWAHETAPPPGVAPVEWLLLTTVPIHTTTDALERLEWYSARWGIEVWHKVLKSGCRIESRQLATAERLTRCLTLYSIIAWRILYATMLARALPDAPCSLLLDDDEWQALYCRIYRVASPPPQPPPLATAVRWIAQLGGFPNRKGDGQPGVMVLWRGFQHLVDLTAMYQIMRQPPLPASQTPAHKRSG